MADSVVVAEKKKTIEDYRIGLIIGIAILLLGIPISQYESSFIDGNGYFSYLFVVWVCTVIVVTSFSFIQNFYKKQEKRYIIVTNRTIQNLRSDYEKQKEKYISETNRTIQNLRSDYDQLKEQLKLDPMTQILNKEQVRPLVTERIRKAIEMNKQFSLIFVDIDSFKDINDQNHALGDCIIKQLPFLIEHKTDEYTFRCGGDEFLVLSNLETGVDASIGFANKIRSKVAGNPFSGLEPDDDRRITVSCGVSTFHRSKRYSDHPNRENQIEETCLKLYREASTACTSAKKYKTKETEKPLKNRVQHFDRMVKENAPAE
jgi:diguanylate cyclase (GGDEF)-like protein